MMMMAGMKKQMPRLLMMLLVAILVNLAMEKMREEEMMPTGL